MSLRDFNASSDDRPVVLNTEPLGNGSGLGSFHTVNQEEREPNNTPKIVGALAVALMVGAGGIYFYSMTGKHPAPIQTASLPAAAVVVASSNLDQLAVQLRKPEPPSLHQQAAFRRTPSRL